MDNQIVQKVYSEVKESLNSIYKKRKRALFFQKIMWAITGIYFILMLLVFASNYIPDSVTGFSFLNLFKASATDPLFNMYPIIGLVVLLYPTTYFFSRSFQNFKLLEIKTISKMVKMLFPKVEFEVTVTAPVQEIAKSKLFAWVKPNSPMFSYGQIRSSINGNAINITDIGIVEDNISNKLLSNLMRIPGINILVIIYQFALKNIFTKKSADNVNYTFRGMFCWLNFSKKLKGHTIILTNNHTTKLDRLSSFKFTNEHKINLEDPRFTDKFLVYSTDQVEARYVLSAKIMERIVDLQEKFNQEILLSFHNQQMYLAVKNSNGLFSFPTGKLDNIKIIEELANDIETALEISSKLN